MASFVLSDYVLSKAYGFLKRDCLTRLSETSWRIRGETGDYLVNSDVDIAESRESGTFRFASCSCAFGSSQGAGQSTCSHVAAVLISIKESRDTRDAEKGRPPAPKGRRPRAT